MKVKPIIAAMPLMFTLLTGCTSDPTTHAVSVQWPFKHSAVQTATTNGDIIEECIALNKAEIAATHYAKMHAQHKKVKHFSAFLHHAHMQNLHDIQHLSHKIGIAPVENTVSMDIKQKGAQELAELKALHHAGFDKLFIADMIRDHRNALNLLDRAIMQSTNAELTVYLKATRHHVEKHLHRAELLKKELNLS